MLLFFWILLAVPLSHRPLFIGAAAIANAAHHSLSYCSSKQWMCVCGAWRESDAQINEFCRFCLHTMSLWWDHDKVEQRQAGSSLYPCVCVCECVGVCVGGFGLIYKLHVTLQPNWDVCLQTRAAVVPESSLVLQVLSRAWVSVSFSMTRWQVFGIKVSWAPGFTVSKKRFQIFSWASRLRHHQKFVHGSPAPFPPR